MLKELKKIEIGNYDIKEIIKEIEKTFEIVLPMNYIEYISQNNDLTINSENEYCDLWKLEDIVSLNKGYKVQELFPNLIYFGSNGGLEAYAFDKSNNMCIVSIPFIGNESDKKVVAKNFNEFIKNIK